MVAVTVDVGDLDCLVLDKGGGLLSECSEALRDEDTLYDACVDNFEFNVLLGSHCLVVF